MMMRLPNESIMSFSSDKTLDTTADCWGGRRGKRKGREISDQLLLVEEEVTKRVVSALLLPVAPVGVGGDPVVLVGEDSVVLVVGVTGDGRRLLSESSSPSERDLLRL